MIAKMVFCVCVPICVCLKNVMRSEMRLEKQVHSNQEIMAVTRSKDIPVVGKKIKFLDEDLNGNDDYHTAEEVAIKSQSENDESDSDDDAPEEVSTSTAKQSIIEKERKQREIELKSREADREKRREKDLQNKLQKQSKKEKKQSRKVEEVDLPEFLPEDIFESLESAQSSGKHLKVKELDEIDQKLMRQKMKEEKLKSIKNSKKLSIKKGPINVQVQSFNINKKVVPRAEAKIVDAREKWLKRKSLNKK